MALNIQNTNLRISAGFLRQFPGDPIPQIAFSGRSNVGKSSLINTLLGRKSLTRVSKVPGKTVTINFYDVDKKMFFVDLPGYGFAKVPLELKEHWKKHLDAYLNQRQSLVGVVLVMDIRHPLSDFDCMMMDWASAGGLPVHVLLSKADKLAFGAAKGALLKVQSRIRKEFAGEISVQLFSAPKRQGVDEAHAQLNRWLFADEDAEEQQAQPE